MNKLSPEDFAEVFQLDKADKVPTIDCEPLTIWIPSGHKAKYDLIQSKSKHKFGKFLREVLKKSIDKVDVEKKTG